MKSAFRAAAFLLSSAALGYALPSTVPLRLHEGFWRGEFAIGAQNFSLTVDTGSFAILVKQGLYQPSATSKPTNLSEFIQFNGASADGIAPAAETIFFVRDDVEFAGATVHDFLVGNITQGDDLPGDGVAGFSPPASDNEDFSQGQGLIETFCQEGDLTPCEFGLAVGKNGTGSIIFGELDQDMITGPITVLQTTTHDSWEVVNSTEADSAILVVDGQPFSHIVPTFDNGTPNIIGPLDTVKAMLQSVGYNITEQTNDFVTVALGTYDCARPAARVGFSFPPSTDVHYVNLEANVLNRTADGRVCTANILGTSTVDAPFWSIGQTWFQGRYVQHNLDNNTLSFVDLKA
ncbi:acid protease [Trametes coccinea BRFM310]|uniref:Acid protease n=1 Tax=Trametes coccinea (strain BRFM310) TaxID=1353009 RepID=A0A1Y2IBE4_TRAC3|nr:acid protease [Trametes coccinea BRFM310]